MFVVNCVLLWLSQFIVPSVALPNFDLVKQDYFTLFLHGSEVQGNILKLIEGHPIAVTCIYRNHTNVAVSWKTGSRTITNSSTLSTPSLERAHTTQYSCHADGYQRIITVLVLYPPKIAEISGPFTVPRGTEFNLTCFANSFPDATYKWIEDPAYFAPHISTEATVTVNTSDVEGDEMWLYCIARNTMVPTNGVPVESSPVTVKRRIIIQGPNAGIPIRDDQDSNGGLTAAAAVGWVVAAVTVALAVLLYFRHRVALGSLERYKRFKEPELQFTNVPRPPPRSNQELITFEPNKTNTRPVSVHSYLDVRLSGPDDLLQDDHVTAEAEDTYDQINVHEQTVTDQQRRTIKLDRTQHTERINISSTGYLIPKRRKSV